MTYSEDMIEIPGLRPKDALLAVEKNLLGAAMQSRAAAEAMAEIVRPANFWLPASQLVAEAIDRLIEDGQDVDPTAVLVDLTERGVVDKVGAGPGLFQLVENRSLSIRGDAIKVARDAYRRRFLQELVSGVQITVGPAFDPDNDIDMIRKRLDAAVGDFTSDQPPTIGELLLKRIDELSKPLNLENSIPPPWIDLKRLVNGGLRPGQVVVVGARPAIGKSVIGLGFARHTAIRYKMPTLLISMEMSNDEVTDRLIAAEAGVSLDRLQGRELSDDEWLKIAEIRHRVEEAPLVVDDSSNCTLARIRARLRGMARKDPARLVVVDYVGLMDSPAVKGETRERQVAELSRGLKLLAKEFGIPIVALHQLNREVTRRSDKRPTMADLRESGAIEADADLIVLLHREDAYNKESPRAGEMELVVDKNRNGPTALITVAFQGRYARAVDFEPEPTIPGRGFLHVVPD